jgi:hypothetical protein
MRTRTNLMIDALLVTAYVIAANPALTGISVHEWVSVGFGLLAITHLIRHREWVARTAARFFARIARMSRVNLAADILAAVAAASVLVSGLAISQTLSALVGLSSAGDSTWRVVHAASATALVASAILHLALHWRWIVRAMRLHVIDPLADALHGAEPPKLGVRAVAWGVPTLLLAGLLSLAVLGTANVADAGTTTATTTSSTSTSTSGTLTCPRTGCTATTCHATSGGSAAGGVRSTGG